MKHRLILAAALLATSATATNDGEQTEADGIKKKQSIVPFEFLSFKK